MKRKLAAACAAIVVALSLAAPALGDGGWGAGPDLDGPPVLPGG
jgi:hypothetical protein